MSEILSIFNSFFSVISFVLVVLLIPLIKFLFDLRLKIERIEVILNIILKDVEQLKKEVYNGEDGKGQGR
jgi:cellobiose-specific phosphotransferase system component IIC